MNLSEFEVPVSDLRWSLDPAVLPFSTTREIEPLDEVIGQERAVRAVDFGLGIEDQGFNIFVCGAPGTGRSSIVRTMIRKIAAGRPTPPDWCYVHNFKSPDQPKALSLPAGKAREFAREVEKLIDDLKGEIPKVFQSKDYEAQRNKIEEDFGRLRDALTADLERKAQLFGFQINSTRLGIFAVPLHKGKPIQPEEFQKLDEATRRDIQTKEKELSEDIRTLVGQVRRLREEANARVQQLDESVVRYATEHGIEALAGKYSDHPRVVDHVREIHSDILENYKDFLPQEESPIQIPGIEAIEPRRFDVKYRVNVLVDHSESKGAPLAEETNPTYNNLIGRIEKKSRLGALYTDFTMIRAGSILNASGGFMVANALDVLRSPFSWDALKRVIKKNEIKIEDIGELYGFIATGGIKPEPIPVHTRVILTGSPLLYYLLRLYDEDFAKAFKVKADFDTQARSTPEVAIAYGRFISRSAAQEGTLPFDREAVAALVSHEVRQAENRAKISLRFSEIADIIREASHWARARSRTVVTSEDVRKAVDERLYRSNLIEERIQDLYDEGTLLVSVKGTAVGQVNGLSVFDLGDYAFGRPTRITARTHLGRAGVVNIEREVRMSGRTHSKAVMILTGYLGGRYAQEKPLSLTGTLTFEQTYGEVHGDSASAAELYALLSAITEIPLRQDLAVTGSINQHGEVQPIGGVNEKVEGFYEVCKAQGLTGTQGVVLPRRNIRHLMLKDEVVDAVASSSFHIYAIDHVEQGLEILTGQTAGERGTDGRFPAGTINRSVVDKLTEMAEKQKEKPADKAAETAEKGNNGEKPPSPPTPPTPEKRPV